MENYQQILKQMIMDAHQEDDDITEEWITDYLKNKNIEKSAHQQLIDDFKWNVIVK